MATTLVARPLSLGLRVRARTTARHADFELFGSGGRRNPTWPTTYLKRKISSLQVSQDRLMASIHESCEFGKAHAYGEQSTETGMARLSLGDADREVRHWFIEKANSLGCKVTIDQMGNIMAVRQGKNAKLPPVMMGSHLDTQPTGGRYDGVLGITAGLEVLKTFEENDYETEGSVGVVNWTNEEGARFPMTAVSSAVWAGIQPLEKVWSCLEVHRSSDGRRHSLKEELERIGFLGNVSASYEAQPIAAHFELHIEQGPILEDEQRRVGVVVGGQAYRWYELTITGKDCHAGTTPFNARQDSLLATAKMIVESNKKAKAHGGLATTGIVEMEPGSTNTMAHTTRFTLDIRHQQDAKLAEIDSACREAFTRIAGEESERGCGVTWKLLTDSPAVQFHKDCISMVEASAEEACVSLPKTSQDGKLWKHMVSGAGHDSCHTNRQCPTSMIFTVTKDGISHNPKEYCSPEDCTLGAQVLLGAVVRYDKLRADRGDFAK